ncbi:hypothetical protein GQ55_4G256300 [Panicum hallii var. hallii]|uniref:Uncharacterized protein n=2 Tax=Panicum hallii TaxID=206008 RepID=A0A2T7E050_9POAL|nr:uncharacterized protein LOC112889881 [Panicum hallii]PAN24666.1 hypothetical protein PAHAL_4G243100 [Panicum hallii]PUZ61204.1 hypothetical protein GQ55_4G256300 [Panicum hallii var. hallii]
MARQTKRPPHPHEPSRDTTSPPPTFLLVSRSRESQRMGATLLQAVAALVGRLQRAARRMAAGAGRGGNGKGSPPRAAAVAPWKKTFSLAPAGKAAREAEAGVWRKEILMGERCQPLDFSGVIYYDAEGRRLAQPPPPRSPMRSPLPASPRIAANARAY